MKVFKLIGTPRSRSILSEPTFSLQGIKVLHDDGFPRNDLQTAMAVIQWLLSKSTITNTWLWDNLQPLCWDDGTPILLD